MTAVGPPAITETQATTILAFKFADGKTQTLLGAVKADAWKRTVEKDGKKVPELVPMSDG